MRSSHILFVAFVLFTNSSIAVAGVFDNVDALIQSGVFASDPRFQSVGMVRSNDADGNPIEGSSGILISPNWVLTAAHVVVGNTFKNASSVTFALGADGYKPTYQSMVVSSIIHPEYNHDLFTLINYTPDLALLRLANPIFEVTPAERFRGIDPIYQNNMRSEYFMAGYGLHGVRGEALENDSLKRAGSNYVESATIPGYLRIYNRPVSILTPNPSFLEWFVATGDSGGGWFLNVNGEWQLAAVSSYGGAPFETTTFSGGFAISPYNAWIDSNIASVPEPSSFAMLAITISISTCFRTWKWRSMKSKVAPLIGQETNDTVDP